MARLKQQGTHGESDSRWMKGADQVNDAEGQDCGNNGHERPMRKEAEQCSHCGSDDRTRDHSIGLRNGSFGKNEKNGQRRTEGRDQKQPNPVMLQTRQKGEHQRDPQILRNIQSGFCSPGAEDGEADIPHTFLDSWTG